MLSGKSGAPVLFATAARIAVTNFWTPIQISLRLLICFVFLCVPLSPVRPSVRNAQNSNTNPASRDCQAGYEERIGKKKSAASKRKGALREIPLLPSCVEVHKSPIEVQEYLQSVVREFRWNIGDEQASEELWSFAIYLGPDAVAAFTKPPADPKITWSSGKGTVNIRTNVLPDGFTRVIVTAKFDGSGEAEDKFAPQRSSWPLPSSGTLEGKLAEAIRKRAPAVH